MKEVTIDEIEKKYWGVREERIRELWRRSRGLYEELENHEELIKKVCHYPAQIHYMRIN